MTITSRSRTRSTDSTQRTPLLDTDAVAVSLGVTPRHVRRLVAERRIPFLKVGRFVRFDPAELNVWLDEQRVNVVKRQSYRDWSPCDTNEI